MIDTNNYFVLYTNCMLVKGHVRSTICDLQHERYKLIPNELFEILSDNQKNEFTLNALFNKYSEDSEGLKLYVDLLIEEGFGFYTDLEPHTFFPPLNTKYEYFGKVSNAIIDYNNKYDHKLLNSFVQHLSLNSCEAVQMRFYSPVSISTLEEIFKYFLTTDITCIELLLPSTDLDEQITKLALEHLRIGSIAFHGSKEKTEELIQQGYRKLIVKKITQKIDSCEACGVINPAYFNVNVSTFTEAISFNSCLNGKIAVDENGYIKNCPSMSGNFGNIQNKYDFVETIESNEFTQYWAINKDKIQECKSCEFRYICQDCRAYTKMEGDILSKPLKCNYNPLSGLYAN